MMGDSVVQEEGLRPHLKGQAFARRLVPYHDYLVELTTQYPSIQEAVTRPATCLVEGSKNEDTVYLAKVDVPNKYLASWHRSVQDPRAGTACRVSHGRRYILLRGDERMTVGYSWQHTSFEDVLSTKMFG